MKPAYRTSTSASSTRGIEPPEISGPRRAEVRSSLEHLLNITFGSTPCLLSLGRQIGRKGIVEFLERGFPLLQPDIHLILCGAGPEHERIRSAIDRLGQSRRVHVLGVVDDDVAAVHGYLQSSVAAKEAKQKEATQKEATAYVLREYSWRRTGDTYIDIFDAIQPSDRVESR